MAGLPVGQHVRRREVAADDLGVQTAGAGPGPPGAAGRCIQQLRLLGTIAALSMVAATALR